MANKVCVHVAMVALLMMLSLVACGQTGSTGRRDTPQRESGQMQQQPEAEEEADDTASVAAPADGDCPERQARPGQESQKGQQSGASPTVARLGDTVRVHRVGILENGDVFDSYQGNRYLQFTLGEGEFLPAFEEKVVGMRVGQTKSFTVSAEEAYGPHYDALVFTIDRSEFPEDKQFEPGQMVQVGDRANLLMRALVVNVTASNVTLDANHLLAGQDLKFEVELVKIVS